MVIPVTVSHNNAPIALHFSPIFLLVKQSEEIIMRNGMTRRAGRLALAIGLLLTVAGCVVYPAGPGYYRPHPCCYY